MAVVYDLFMGVGAVANVDKDAGFTLVAVVDKDAGSLTSCCRC